MVEEEITAEKMMNKKVQTVELDSSVTDCAKTMMKGKVGYAVIVRLGTAMGIVTERDLVEVIAENLDPSKVLVRDVMSTPLITIKPSASMTEVAERISGYNVRRLVVIDDRGNLVGIVAASDLARILAQRKGFADVTLNAIARLESPANGPYQ